MRLSPRPLPVLLVLGALAACTEDDSTCGATQTLEATASYRVSRSASGDFSDIHWYPASFDGSRVHFRFDTDIIQNVCSAEHMKSKMLVRFTGSPPAGIQVTAAVPYYVLFEQPIPLSNSCEDGECTWQGETEVGMRQVTADGTQPGQFYVWLDISWPSAVGNRVADSILFYRDLTPYIVSTSTYKDFTPVSTQDLLAPRRAK